MVQMKKSQFETLRQNGIRHFDELIHDQDKKWLLDNFSEGASNYPINVTRLLRNIIWQLRERIITGQKEPLQKLIRTFWYMYIKPTLSCAGALSRSRDQYADLITQLNLMVRNKKLMSCK